MLSTTHEGIFDESVHLRSYLNKIKHNLFVFIIHPAHIPYFFQDPTHRCPANTVDINNDNNNNKYIIIIVIVKFIN